MTNDRETWAQQLYARLPEIYRERDLEIALTRAPGSDPEQALGRAPLLGLLRAIAGQVAVVRQNLDDLWDNYFIETCEDWVVPYIGSLLGTNLVPSPVGRADRLDVRDTIRWRRSKGTPVMLAELASATTGWPAELAEFFRTMAWVQNLNHQVPSRLLPPDLGDPYVVSRLGRVDDSFAHIADIRPRDVGASARTVLSAGPDADVTPVAAWGTPGRYVMNNVGLFVRPLTTFKMQGVTPASGPPFDAPTSPAEARGYTFDPIFRDVPLFSGATATLIDRAEFEHAPEQFVGPQDTDDLTVRRFGISLALAGAGRPTFGTSTDDFTFGTPDPAVRLDAAEGLRVLEPAAFHRPAEHFVITAFWVTSGGLVRLGALNTFLLPDQSAAFRPDAALGAAGRLLVRIECGGPDPSLGWNDVPSAGPGHFPAAVLAARDDQVPRAALDEDGNVSAYGGYADALFVYLPERFVWPGVPIDLLVDASGATYTAEGPDDAPQRGALARSAEGQVWPPADLEAPSSWPFGLTRGLHRAAGIRAPDPGRFASFPGLMVEAYLMTGSPQLLGGLATRDMVIDADVTSRYRVPNGATGWPAFTFLPSLDAAFDRLPVGEPAVVAVSARPIDPTILDTAPAVCPQVEVVLTDRASESLLVYIPELELTAADPQAWLAVADDGSTYRVSGDAVGVGPNALLPFEAELARVGAGQVLPLEGTYPLRRRAVVSGSPGTGELSIDPERGRFCLAPDDPLLALALEDRDLSVDYVEAFGDAIGARAFDRGLSSDSVPATRMVSASGDAWADVPFWRIHGSLGEALAQATNGDVIEIADSATYRETLTVDLSDPSARLDITIRAAAEPRFERPCLLTTSTDDPPVPPLSIRGVQGLDPADALQLTNRVEVNGLLIVGGAVTVDDGYVADIEIVACTLEPGEDEVSLVANDADPNHRAGLTVCRSITGKLRLGQGLHRLVVVDSIVDGGTGLAVGGLTEGSDPSQDDPAPNVQLERVTVRGRVRCGTLVASEALLGDLASVDDRQTGCIRFSRYEPGSVLPRKFQCVPSDAAASAGERARPAFASLRRASPSYVWLAAACSPLVLSASEEGDQVGAFASAHPGLRVANLQTKLAEFLPIGLRPLIISEP